MTPIVVLGTVGSAGLLGGLLAAFGLIQTLRRRLQARTVQLEELKVQILEWNRRLEEKVAERTRELEKLHGQLQQIYLETVTSLVEAMAAKDKYLFNHSHNVACYAEAIARELRVPADRIQRLRLGCNLHDLGKIAVPEAILLKQGPLTPEEYAIVKQHPIWGARILEPLTFLKDITEMVHQEHERWDGTGYPQGLKGEEIRLEARIIAVADALDAMTSHRSYRKQIPLAQAGEELWRYAGTQFDTPVVEACLRAIRSGRLTTVPSAGEKGPSLKARDFSGVFAGAAKNIGEEVSPQRITPISGIGASPSPPLGPPESDP